MHKNVCDGIGRPPHETSRRVVTLTWAGQSTTLCTECLKRVRETQKQRDT
jgi:hypothetical protein